MSAPNPGRSFPATLDAWAKFLTDTELPAFARTVSDVSRIAEDPQTSAGNLSNAIMKDAAMSARLVKLANSPLFPSSHGNIQTVARGVVLLGFDAVRDLAISLSVIETALTGDSRESLLVEMALAFHTATQAQNLATMCRDNDVNEVFVAGLLYRIGMLAVLSSSDPRIGRYVAEKATIGDDGAELMRLERRLFGCDMTQLSRRLAQHWSLGQALQQALAPNSSQVGARIVMARRIAELSMHRGWESDEVHALLARCARTLDLALPELEEKILEGSEAARDMAIQFGASKAAPLIPETPDAKARRELSENSRGPRSHSLDVDSAQLDAELQHEPAEIQPATESQPRNVLSPNPLVQLEMLGRISEQFSGKPDLNLLLKTVIEGVHRGIGMDRTVFALMTAGHNSIAAKFFLSESDEDLRTNFRFDLRSETNPLLASVIRQHQAFWMHQGASSVGRDLLRGPFSQFVGKADFLIHPVLFGDRCIGFVYADRASSARPIDAGDQNSFRRFLQQLAIGLRLINGA